MSVVSWLMNIQMASFHSRYLVRGHEFRYNVIYRHFCFFFYWLEHQSHALGYCVWSQLLIVMLPIPGNLGLGMKEERTKYIQLSIRTKRLLWFLNVFVSYLLVESGKHRLNWTGLHIRTQTAVACWSPSQCRLTLGRNLWKGLWTNENHTLRKRQKDWNRFHWIPELKGSVAELPITLSVETGL